MPSDPRLVGRDVIRKEAEALSAAAERLGPEFDAAVDAIVTCAGRVVVCAVGKSGHLGLKLASTLSSTGTPAAFLHAGEGAHGDVGLVTAHDVVVAISNSGTTPELSALLPTIRETGATLIALTASPRSALARAADVVLAFGEVREADPLGVVPTVSGALTLAYCDALTVAVMTRRGFGAEAYARVHPSGAIGRKMTLRVGELLRGAETNPTVRHDASFGGALETVTRHTLGGVCVVDEAGLLVGIVTDGDVRRTFAAAAGAVKDLLARPVSDFMTRRPTSVRADALAFEALRTMEGHRPRPIYLLPVLGDDDRPVGMVHLHTLVQAGLTNGRDEA